MRESPREWTRRTRVEVDLTSPSVIFVDRAFMHELEAYMDRTNNILGNYVANIPDKGLTFRRIPVKVAPPEESAFVSTILDNPDDEGPRLVYADWLEEHGHCRAAADLKKIAHYHEYRKTRPALLT